MFWPKEVWGLYADKLEDFRSEENSHNAVKALNDLVLDALRSSTPKILLSLEHAFNAPSNYTNSV